MGWGRIVSPALLAHLKSGNRPRVLAIELERALRPLRTSAFSPRTPRSIVQRLVAYAEVDRPNPYNLSRADPTAPDCVFGSHNEAADRR